MSSRFNNCNGLEFSQSLIRSDHFLIFTIEQLLLEFTRTGMSDTEDLHSAVQRILQH